MLRTSELKRYGFAQGLDCACHDADEAVLEDHAWEGQVKVKKDGHVLIGAIVAVVPASHPADREKRNPTPS